MTPNSNTPPPTLPEHCPPAHSSVIGSDNSGNNNGDDQCGLESMMEEEANVTTNDPKNHDVVAVSKTSSSSSSSSIPATSQAHQLTSPSPSRPSNTVLYGDIFQKKITSLGFKWRRVVLNIDTGTLFVYRLPGDKTSTTTRQPTDYLLRDRWNASRGTEIIPRATDKDNGKEAAESANALLCLRLPKGSWIASDAVRTEGTFVVTYDASPSSSYFGGTSMLRKGRGTDGSSIGEGRRGDAFDDDDDKDEEKRTIVGEGEDDNSVYVSSSLTNNRSPLSRSARKKLGTLFRNASSDVDQAEMEELLKTVRSMSGQSVSTADVETVSAASSSSSPPTKTRVKKTIKKATIFLKCPGGGNEKAMWIRGIQKVGALFEQQQQHERGSEDTGWNGRNGTKSVISTAAPLSSTAATAATAIVQKNWRYRTFKREQFNPQRMSIAMRSSNAMEGKEGVEGENQTDGSPLRPSPLDDTHLRGTTMFLSSSMPSAGTLHDSMGYEKSEDATESTTDNTALVRTPSGNLLPSRQAPHAGGGHSTSSPSPSSVERHHSVKEYRVRPFHSYPNRWMTGRELDLETMRTSKYFNDLRPISSLTNSEAATTKSRGTKVTNHKEGVAVAPATANLAYLGSLHVEVLSCTGLPKLDTFSDTDAVVYLVCSPNSAFCTDVIPDCNSPRWPCRSKRACIFPLYHAYARLYAGVFDDDGAFTSTNSFCGRVVVDIATLRPASVYDVTLPLRESAQVYRRKPRGTIRLRFRVDWHDERKAVFSHLLSLSLKEKKTTMIRSDNASPATSSGLASTINCGDEVAFRAIALTVHGNDMGGKYGPTILRATQRELKLYKIHTKVLLKTMVKDISSWKHVTLSAFVFWGWMHSVYVNSVSVAFPYAIGFVILVLMRNYASCNIDGSFHWGYAPLTIMELVLSIVRGSSSEDGIDDGFGESARVSFGEDISSSIEGGDCVVGSSERVQQQGVKKHHRRIPNMKPLLVTKQKKIMRARTSVGTSSSAVGGDSGAHSTATEDEALTIRVKNQPCIASRLFKILGFLNSDDNDRTTDSAEPDHKTEGKIVNVGGGKGGIDHIEFPFSNGRKDTKMCLEEATADQQPLPKKSSKKGENVDDYEEEEEEEEEASIFNTVGGVFENPKNKLKAFGTNLVKKMHHTSKEHKERQHNSAVISQVERNLQVGTEDNGPMTVSPLTDREEIMDPLLAKLPDQNVAVVAKKRTTIIQDLEEMRNLAHKFTMNCFDDTVFKFRKVTKREDGTGGGFGMIGLTRPPIPIAPASPSSMVDSSSLPSGSVAPSTPPRPSSSNESKTSKTTSSASKPAPMFDNVQNLDEIDEPSVIQMMERSLGIGVYRNPITKLKAPFAGRAIAVVRVGLSLYRATFNIFMWRDPYLSFWFLVALVVLTLVLMVFPWRQFLFATGLAFVGPQNWIIRKCKEKDPGMTKMRRRLQRWTKKAYDNKKNPSQNDKTKRVAADNAGDEGIKNHLGDTLSGQSSTTHAPAQLPFMSHNARDSAIATASKRARECHIVVPYSPIRRERFYDWPPEPTLSMVACSLRQNHPKDVVCCSPLQN